MSELIEQDAPRCGECGIPLSMHHDPGCSQPCQRCELASLNAQIRWLLLTFALLAGILAVWLGGVAFGAGKSWAVVPFAVGLVVAGAAWVYAVRRANER